MRTIKIDETRLISAIVLIENHLDGAVTDYENELVDNVDVLDDLIYVHKILGMASSHGFSALGGDEYEERMEKAKKQRSKGEDDE